MRTETDALLSLQRHVAAALPDFVEILTEVENERTERPYAVVSVLDDLTPDASTHHPHVTLPVTVYAYVKGATRTAARRAAEDAREALWRAFAVGDAPNRERLVPLYDYAGRPAVQRVQLAGAAGGTWTLALDDVATPAIPLRAQPRDVRLALEQLPGLAGNVWVYGRRGGPWDVRFDGALRGQPVDELVADVAGLAGPAPSASVEVVSAGSPEPWRTARDYMRVVSPTFGGLRDPSDARLRTVIVSLRLTWGRGGHVPSAEMLLSTITARVRSTR